MRQHRAIHLPGRQIGRPGELQIDKALVVTQVHVRFPPVAGNEHLPMLVRGHGAWVNVEVGVELHDRYGDAAVLEDAADRGDSNALPNGAHDATGNENVFSGSYQADTPTL